MDLNRRRRKGAPPDAGGIPGGEGSPDRREEAVDSRLTDARDSLLGWVSESLAEADPKRGHPGDQMKERLALRLIRAGRASYRGQMVLALFVGAIGWGDVALAPLAAWVGLIVVTAWGRSAYPERVRHRRTGPEDRQRAVTLGMAVSALTWSAGFVLLAPGMELPRLILIVALILVMITASAITAAAYPRGFLVYEGILTLGLVSGILLHGRNQVHWIAAAVVLASAVWVGFFLMRGMHRALRLEFRSYIEIESLERKAERESAFLAALFQSLDEGVVVTQDSVVVGMNRGFEAMFGWSWEEAVGNNLVDLVVPEGDRAAVREENTELQEGETAVRDVTRVSREGRELQVRVSVARVEGLPRIVVVLYSDITELKDTQAALERARAMAEAANEAKSEFLATMSHEIRTPMNAIIGMAELLAETELTPSQRDYVEVFRTAGDTLLNLINQILDLSKIEAGHLALDDTDFDLWKLLERTAQVFAVPAHQKGVELAVHVEPEVRRWVRGDPDRLRQVLANLLGNAVKFTDEGEVVLHVCPKTTDEVGRASAGHRVYFEVKDTGPGIPEDRQDAIFERFTQADSSTTRKHGGTGLGLTISQALVRLMGGSLKLESEEGVGTSFSFSIPLEEGVPGETEAPERPDAEDLVGRRVLVVDDNATNRMILHEILTSWGADPTCVSRGSEALEAVSRARDEDDPFGLILLDGHMPEMDGFDVAEELQESRGLDGATLMMLTSSGNHTRDVRRARELGIASYLVKPIKRAELMDAVLGVLGSEPAVEGAGEASSAVEDGGKEGSRGARILLVEDTEENRMVVEAYLAGTDHRVTAVESGEAAVETFTSSPDAFDLILMDIRMPGMDGYEATRQIRGFEGDSDVEPIPIVALTAHALDEERRKSHEAGCDAHLTKPIKKKRLLDAIQSYARGSGSVAGPPDSGSADEGDGR